MQAPHQINLSKERLERHCNVFKSGSPSHLLWKFSSQVSFERCTLNITCAVQIIAQSREEVYVLQSMAEEEGMSGLYTQCQKRTAV